MWKKVFLAVSLLVGLGLFIFVIWQFGGVGKTLEVVGQVGWVGLALFVANACLTQVFPGIGWWMLMRGEGLRVTLWTALKANFMGFPINFLAPSMYLGAEPLKLFYVSRVHGESKRRVLATIIVSKFQEVGALLLVMIGAAGIAVWKLDFSRQQETLLFVTMGALVVLFGFLLYAFIGNLQPTVKIINLLASLGVARRKLARLRTRAIEMEEIIHLTFTRRWRTFLAAQGVTLLSAAALLMRPWIFFYFTRDRILLGGEYLCAIYVATNMINSLPHTPGGLGIFEGTMVMLFALMGIGEANATAFSVVSRLADFLLILVGAWLIVHYNLQAIAKRVAEGEEKVTVGDARAAPGEPGEPPPAP